MNFQLLIKGKLVKKKAFFALQLADVVFIPLINVIIKTIVGILTFMSMMDFILS